MPEPGKAGFKDTKLGRNWKWTEYVKELSEPSAVHGSQYACVSSPTNFSVSEHCDFLLSKPQSVADELPGICVPWHGDDMQCQYWNPTKPTARLEQNHSFRPGSATPPASKHTDEGRNQESYSEM